MSQNEIKLMGVQEVAQFIGISPNTVYLWTRQGKLPFFKLGKLLKFRIKDVEDWLEKHESSN